MSYSQFTLSSAVLTFNLTLREGLGILSADTNPINISEFLQQQLDFGLPLAVAVGSEKARSEFIIAPLLGELKRNTGWALFSGVEFDVDSSVGLNGFVDFLMSVDPEQLFVKSPVAVVIEAKKDDIASGLGQCAATMVAAQRFNGLTQVIRGAVTTGTVWRLMALQENILAIDLAEVTDFARILAFFAQT